MNSVSSSNKTVPTIADLDYPKDKYIDHRVGEMLASERRAKAEVAKKHEILEKALWRRESDFLDHMSTKLNIFDIFMFVDLDNQYPPKTGNPLPGVAVICVGKKESYCKFLEDNLADLRAFQQSGSLFCFTCGNYQEAADDLILLLGIELACVTKKTNHLVIFVSQDRVFSITAEGVQSQNPSARAACIFHEGRNRTYSIQQVVDYAEANLHPRAEAPPQSAWWNWFF